MANYRYLFADVLTNQVLTELPLTSVNFTQQLNTAGTFTGKLLLSGVNASGLNVANSTIPGRTAIYVDRDGVLVWGGVLWTRDWTAKDQMLAFTAREFESYFERRRITADTVFYGVDQLAAVQTIVNNAQAVTNGNVGITVGTETSGVLINRTFYGYEYKTVFSAIQELSKTSTGFDFNITVAYDSNGLPSRTLHLGYPRWGRTYLATSQNALVFDMPGNVIDYEWTEDGITAANTVYALGAGSNPGKLISTSVDSTKISSGWPILEDQINYSDVIDSTLLTTLSAGQVGAVSYPPQTIKLLVSPSLDPVFGSYEVGDSARIRIKDDRFPAGLDAVYRIISFNMQAGENNQAEEVTITLTYTTN